MKIVIDIDDEVYKRFMDDYVGCPDIIYAVRKGIPLPKGHGRLIDVDALREDFKTSKKISFAERMDISCIVDHAPTIIEAEGSDAE